MADRQSANPPGRYVTAAGRRGLTDLYDPALALTMREKTWRPDVVNAILAEPRPRRVVDVGTGTGTLAIGIARRAPDVKVTGVDGDSAILAKAAAKAAAAGVQIELLGGLAENLPVAGGAADVVVMTLVLHHLTAESKRAALMEAHRVLRPGGRLVIADWGKPIGPVSRGLFFLLQLLDGFATTRDHAAGAIPGVIEACGFVDVHRARRWRTAWGTLELLTGERA